MELWMGTKDLHPRAALYTMAFAPSSLWQRCGAQLDLGQLRLRVEIEQLDLVDGGELELGGSK